MYLRSLASANGAALANSAGAIYRRHTTLRSIASAAAPMTPAVTSTPPWSHSTVLAELASLTRLFRRLMRARSRTLDARSLPHAAASNADQPALPRRHASDASMSTRVDSPGVVDVRIPALYRKSPSPRRLSPVQVGASFSSRHTAATPRVHADPVDPQRVVISGSFAEVCATLDRLVAGQEATAES